MNVGKKERETIKNKGSVVVGFLLRFKGVLLLRVLSLLSCVLASACPLKITITILEEVFLEV